MPSLVGVLQVGVTLEYLQVVLNLDTSASIKNAFGALQRNRSGLGFEPPVWAQADRKCRLVELPFHRQHR
jgi:hypothetical protein